MSLGSSSLFMSEKLLGGKSSLYDELYHGCYDSSIHIDRTMYVDSFSTESKISNIAMIVDSSFYIDRSMYSDSSLT